jgi:hypothetical protein
MTTMMMTTTMTMTTERSLTSAAAAWGVPVRGEVPGAGVVKSLVQARLRRAKAAWVTRRSSLDGAMHLRLDGLKPVPGDLLLARVRKLGQHSALQLANGRRAKLFVGDEIIVCYGHRYAPDQFEALVPDDLDACHLVAAGGIAARARYSHGRMRRPTEIEPLGLLADAAGRVLNLAQFREAEAPARSGSAPRVIGVVGTSMNAGKTTAAAHLVRGLVGAGLKVAAAKVTGTGAAGDTLLFVDAGASPVVDFTDFGHASTYRVPAPEVERILVQTIRHLARSGVDCIVFEVADGLLQVETAALLGSSTFSRVVDGLVFAAPDSMGAGAGVEWLEQRGLPVLAVSGALTASPLAAAEARRATQLPVLDLDDLSEPEQARGLILVLDQRLAGLRA